MLEHARHITKMVFASPLKLFFFSPSSIKFIAGECNRGSAGLIVRRHLMLMYFCEQMPARVMESGYCFLERRTMR